MSAARSTVLVPLDGSARSERALPLAIRVAEQAGLRLVLLSVVDDDAEDPSARDEYGARVAWLEHVAAATRARTSAPVSCEMRSGDAAASIAGAAESLGAACIVMAHHDHGVLVRVLLGSVTTEVTATSNVPVLVVPIRDEDDEVIRTTSPSVSHMLVALDGSEGAEATLVPVRWLADRFGAGVTLATVVDTGDPRRATLLPTALLTEAPLDATPVHVEDEALVRYLVMQAEGMPGVRVTTRVVPGHPVARVLLEMARESGADIVALTTHARAGLGRIVLGSVAQDVLRLADRPVLLCGPHA